MLRYSGPFLFLFSIPVFYYGLGAAGPLLSVALLLAALIGAELLARRGDGPAEKDSIRFRLLVWFYIPLQLIAIICLALRACVLGLVCEPYLRR